MSQGGWLNEYSKPSYQNNKEKSKKNVVNIEQLSNASHELRFYVSTVEQLTNQIENPNLTIVQRDQKRERMKEARDIAKKKLKEFMEELRVAEQQNLYQKTKKEKQQFKKIRDSFFENREYKRMDEILKNSIAREKQILNKQMNEWKEKNKNEEGEEDSGKERLEQKLRLNQYDANTVETEKAIANQKLEDLQNLEVEMNDLHQCYVDLKELLLEQQDGIDQAQQNVEDANTNIEFGITNLKAANAAQKNSRNMIFFVIIFVVMVAIAGGLLAFLMFKP